jgi:hypothetical protein
MTDTAFEKYIEDTDPDVLGTDAFKLGQFLGQIENFEASFDDNIYLRCVSGCKAFINQQSMHNPQAFCICVACQARRTVTLARMAMIRLADARRPRDHA